MSLKIKTVVVFLKLLKHILVLILVLGIKQPLVKQQNK